MQLILCRFGVEFEERQEISGSEALWGVYAKIIDLQVLAFTKSRV